MEAASSAVPEGQAPGIRCPHCGSPLPVHPHYVTWCEDCDWNLEPQRTARPLSSREERREQRALQRAERLHERIRGEGIARQGLDPRRVLSYLLAVPALLLSPALAAAAILLVLGSWPSVIGIVLGVVVMGIALAIRPRFGAGVHGANTVTRKDAPALFALLDRIATVMEDGPPVVIAATDNFTAATRCVRERRRAW